MWPNRIADGGTRTTTPGILSDTREQEIEDAAASTNTTNGVVGVPQPTSINVDTSDSLSTTTTTSNPSQTTSIDEFPILDELDRLAKVEKER